MRRSPQKAGPADAARPGLEIKEKENGVNRQR